MRALFYDGNRLFLQEISRPIPSAGEALIRVLYSGICNTDLEILRGYMNFTGVIGHEFVGVVEQCREKSWLGKRVVGEINCGCGHCEYCRMNLSRHCPERTVLGILGRPGAHAQYLTLPCANLHPVPARVSDPVAVFTEPLAAALEIVEQIHLRPGMKVAVIGDGKLGQLIASVLLLFPVELVVIGKNRLKLKLLQKRQIPVVESGKVALPPQDVVIECSGVPEGLHLADSLTRPRGTIVLKSTYHGENPFNPVKWVIDEITVVGSRCGPFDPALQLLQNKQVDPMSLISEIVPASNALHAFDLAQNPDALKILIDWRQ